MTLAELKARVDATYSMHEGRAEKIDVCIPNNKGGMGGTSVTQVKFVGKGIDWDSSKFFIWPENEMIERDKK